MTTYYIGDSHATTFRYRAENIFAIALIAT